LSEFLVCPVIVLGWIRWVEYVTVRRCFWTVREQRGSIRRVRLCRPTQEPPVVPNGSPKPPGPDVIVTGFPNGGVVDPEKPAPPPDKGGGMVGVVPDGQPAPLVGAALSAGAGADAASTRAAGLAGAMLGVLALASGLAWALYKFKPGLIPLPGAGGGPAGAGAPSAASPLLGPAGQ